MITLQLKSHFLRLYQIALSDDNFDILELQLLYKIANERGVPKEELDKLFLSPIDHNSTIPEDLITRIEYLYDLTCMIWADGIITEDELNTLKKYCKKFDFLDENINELADFLIESVKNNVKKEDIVNQINQ